MIELQVIEKFPFPALDFRFVNRGSATAVLSEIGIELLSSKLDLSPILSFSYEVEDGRLELYSSNAGWGDAKECQFRLSESSLDSIFSKADLSFVTSVPSGETAKVHSVAMNHESSTQFSQHVNDTSRDTNRDKLNSNPITTENEILVHENEMVILNPKMVGEYREEMGTVHTLGDDSQVHHKKSRWNIFDYLVLSPEGFRVVTRHRRMYAAVHPQIPYICRFSTPKSLHSNASIPCRGLLRVETLNDSTS